MTFSSTPTGGKAYMQTYEYFRYQPGKSQLVAITHRMIETMANVLKFAGLSDGVNGIEFQLDGTTKQFVIYSSSTNGNQTVTQSNWNMDKLDGTGGSGLTLDITKEQILILDFQALYVGRVRIGFDINGTIVYAHEFLNANSLTSPYIAYANLPVRVGMTCTGTVSTTMNYNCCSVMSEGGQENQFSYAFTTELTGTAGNSARAHILSLRPLTTFNSITNRVKFKLTGINFLVTGANNVLWELVIGQAITGASYSAVNATYSAMEISGGTISGSPALVIDSGYVVATSGKGDAAFGLSVASRYPITLDQVGAVRSLGTLSIIATGLGGTSALRCAMKWEEIR